MEIVMDKDAIITLARKIMEADNIRSNAVNISMRISSVSKDKFIIKHNEQSIKESIIKIKESLHKIEEYLEELETHIYDGKMNDE